MVWNQFGFQCMCSLYNRIFGYGPNIHTMYNWFRQVMIVSMWGCRKTLASFEPYLLFVCYLFIIISPKLENFCDIMGLVAPPPPPPSSPPSPPPPPHANACTGHNFVTNTPIKFIFAIAIEVPDYKNPMILSSIGKTKWPLAAILYKNDQKACGISNCVTNSPINFIFGIAIDNT